MNEKKDEGPNGKVKTESGPNAKDNTGKSVGNGSEKTAGTPFIKGCDTYAESLSCGG